MGGGGSPREITWQGLGGESPNWYPGAPQFRQPRGPPFVCVCFRGVICASREFLQTELITLEIFHLYF